MNKYILYDKTQTNVYFDCDKTESNERLHPPPEEISALDRT